VLKNWCSVYPNYALNTKCLRIGAAYIQTTRDPYPLYLPTLMYELRWTPWAAPLRTRGWWEIEHASRGPWPVGSHRLPHLISYLNCPFVPIPCVLMGYMSYTQKNRGNCVPVPGWKCNCDFAPQNSTLWFRASFLKTENKSAPVSVRCSNGVN
jgi:hypothetical protein